MAMDMDRRTQLQDQADALYWWGNLIAADFTPVEALERVIPRSRACRVALESTRQSLMQGETAKQPMRQSGAFLPLVPILVGIGEETAQLGDTLITASQFVDKIGEVASFADPAGDFALPVAFYAFALLINSGASLLWSLQTMGDLPIPDAPLFNAMAERVEGGDSFSFALSQVGGDTFVANGERSITDESYMRIIEEGDREGTLHLALKLLANKLMKQAVGIDAFPDPSLA